ncbi:MAG: sodium/glutamate symporter [Burkholderiales bacterium]|nr:sodium/glutamate symporter [Burkholderiales bacterium]
MKIPITQLNRLPMNDPALVINISGIQALALAVCTYYFGVWAKKKIPILERFSIPSPVVGGMTFAFILSTLQALNILQVNFDSTLQTLLMLAFFTTIGLSASLKVVKQGGKLLVGFLIAVTILTVIQNLLGMGLAKMMGLNTHYGILAGSVSLMGGLGTAAAFGPYFQDTYNIAGGTAVAITAATFGMVAALMIGAPFGEWLIHRYRIKTPKEEGQKKELKIPQEIETDVMSSNHTATLTPQLLKAGGVVAICMALGSVVSSGLAYVITLPAYIGSMLVATIVRNYGDFTGKYTIESQGLNSIGDISLILFVTMAINSLKLHELLHLAIPLVVILFCQTVVLITFFFFVFLAFGKVYDSVMLCVGGIGFSMGSTANGLANMQALAEKYGTSPRAWLVVSLVGAFLIDLINALLITWMGTW